MDWGGEVNAYQIRIVSKTSDHALHAHMQAVAHHGRMIEYVSEAYDMHLPPSSAQHFSNSLFEFYRPLDGAAFLACLDTDEERATMFKIFWGGEE
jgi:hypothetical protein